MKIKMYGLNFRVSIFCSFQKRATQTNISRTLVYTNTKKTSHIPAAALNSYQLYEFYQEQPELQVLSSELL